MYVKADLPKISTKMKWRYLDSLDSTRYSKTEFVDQSAPVKSRIEQAAIEMIVTMLMGNGIIVPNNQFIDSIGFLRIASSMINVAINSRMKSYFIPILYANYDYPDEKKGEDVPDLKDPFLLAAYLFDKDGKEDHGNFELSSLPDLGDRRRKWATCLREKKMGIPSSLITSDLEGQLASDLIRILGFFSQNRHLIIDAIQTKGIRESMTASIADLTNKNLENDEFFVSLLNNNEDASDNPMTRLTDIISVFKKLKENGILDNRTEIRKKLIKTPDYYFKDIKGTHERTRIGVLKTLYSIYNFAGYKSTKATQDNQTEPLYTDDVWGPDEAAFALGRWSRENYESSEKGEKARFDILSNQDLFIDASVNVPPIENDKDELINLWRAFFGYQQDKEWETSLTAYINSLNQYENVKKEFDSISDHERTSQIENDLIDAAKRYEECRIKHIETLKSWLPSDYRVEEDERKKLILTCLDKSGKPISRVQIEDFAEHPTLTKIEKGAQYASEVDKDVSAKGCTAEYGD